MTCSMLGNVAVVAVGVIKTLLIVLGPIPEAEDSASWAGVKFNA